MFIKRCQKQKNKKGKGVLLPPPDFQTFLRRFIGAFCWTHISLFHKVFTSSITDRWFIFALVWKEKGFFVITYLSIFNSILLVTETNIGLKINQYLVVSTNKGLHREPSKVTIKNWIWKIIYRHLLVNDLPLYTWAKSFSKWRKVNFLEYHMARLFNWRMSY